MSRKLEELLNRKCTYFSVGFALAVLLSPSPVLAKEAQAILLTLSSLDEATEIACVVLLTINAVISILFIILGAKLLMALDTSRFKIIARSLVLPLTCVFTITPLLLLICHIGVEFLFLISLNAAVFLSLLSFTLRVRDT